MSTEIKSPAPEPARVLAVTEELTRALAKARAGNGTYEAVYDALEAALASPPAQTWEVPDVPSEEAIAELWDLLQRAERAVAGKAANLKPWADKIPGRVNHWAVLRDEIYAAIRKENARRRTLLSPAQPHDAKKSHDN